MITLLNKKFCQVLGVSFDPNQVLRDLKYRSFLKFDFKMAASRCFLPIKSTQCNASYDVNIYQLIDFYRTVVTLLNKKFCRLSGVSFHPNQVLRDLKMLKFA